MHSTNEIKVSQYRRRRGATLSLIAACAVLVMVLGIGIYLIVRVLGGEREAANATDAGALGVAKATLQTPAVTINSPSDPEFGEFYYLGAQTTGRSGMTETHSINLLTYNRCVAQALLVAINGQEGGGSMEEARKEYQQLTNLGNKLGNLCKNPGVIAFNADAQANPLRMLESNRISGAESRVSGYQYMKSGGSTNVYFYRNQFNTNSLPDSIQTTVAPPGTTLIKPNVTLAGESAPSQYMAGYVKQEIPNVGAFVGVPVFPQQKPHLVSLGVDGWSAPGNVAWRATPPNAWKYTARVKGIDGTKLVAQATAAAIVGAANWGKDKTNTSDFAASIPGGYIAFINDGANYLSQSVENSIQNDQNIFNNLLGVPSSNNYGVDSMAGAGSSVLFSSQPGQVMQGLLYYANTNQTYQGQQGKNKSGSAPNWSQIYVATNPGSPGIPCSQTRDNCQSYFTTPENTWPRNPGLGTGNTGNYSNCLSQLEQAPFGLVGSCVDWIQSIANTPGFGAPIHGNPQPNPQNWSNVDYLKSQVLVAFHQSKQSFTLTANGLPPSGLGVYHYSTGAQNTTDMNALQVMPGKEALMPAIAAWPDSKQMPLQMTGSIAQLINQVSRSTNSGPNACGEKIYTKILQLANQIKPGMTKPELITLLRNTPLPMGSMGTSAGAVGRPYVAYLYMPSGDPTKTVLCTKYSVAHDTNPNIENFTGSIQQPGGPQCDGLALPNDGGCFASTYDIMGFTVDATNPFYGTTSNDPANGNAPPGTKSLNDGGGFTTFDMGDDDLHDRPYVRMGESATRPNSTATFSTGQVKAKDSIKFVPNSGFGGLLGALEFTNDASGTTNLSRIN